MSFPAIRSESEKISELYTGSPSAASKALTRSNISWSSYTSFNRMSTGPKEQRYFSPSTVCEKVSIISDKMKNSEHARQYGCEKKSQCEKPKKKLHSYFLLGLQGRRSSLLKNSVVLLIPGSCHFRSRNPGTSSHHTRDFSNFDFNIQYTLQCQWPVCRPRKPTSITLISRENLNCFFEH